MCVVENFYAGRPLIRGPSALFFTQTFSFVCRVCVPISVANGQKTWPPNANTHIYIRLIFIYLLLFIYFYFFIYLFIYLFLFIYSYLFIIYLFIYFYLFIYYRAQPDQSGL